MERKPEPQARTRSAPRQARKWHRHRDHLCGQPRQTGARAGDTPRQLPREVQRWMDMSG